MNTVKFTYLRDVATGRVITLARRWANEAHTVMEYGTAVCNPKDHFNKARGRTIATGRLEKNSWNVKVGDQRSAEEAVVEHLLSLTEASETRLTMSKWLYARACRRLDRQRRLSSCNASLVPPATLTNECTTK
jgi:hypothetical protein